MIRSIFRPIAAVALLAAGAIAQAQTLTNTQLQTLCTAVKAAPTADALRAAGNATSLEAWLNAARAPQQLAWNVLAPPSVAEEAPTYTTYDSLAAGKRDSWVVFLRNPRDFSRARVRSWVVDVWGNATAGSNAEAVLLAGTFSASNGQFALGGTARTTGTVTAWSLNWPTSIPGTAVDWLVQGNCN